MKITSVNNDLVKETAKLLKGKYRDETGLFLIEGEKGVYEAINAGINIERIFILENHNIDVIANAVKQSSCVDNSSLRGAERRSNPEGKRTGLPRLKPRSDVQIIETTEAVLAKISDAKSAPKVIAIAKQPKQNTESFKNAKKIILLEGIKDAGNLGTILRTAAAFGIDGIVLYGDTVDLYNPKCVRSTVGCLWKTPVIQIKDFTILKDIFTPFERIATLPKGDGINIIELGKYTPSEKILVMFGSEADGLSKELKAFATKNVTIEMSENVESLNLSISAAVFMYKIRG